MASAILYFCSHYALLLLFLACFLTPLIWAFFLRKRKKRGFFLLLFPLFAVLNLIYGTEWNNDYVAKHGVKSTGVVLRIVPTNRWVNHVQQVSYECLIRTKNGKTTEVQFVNNGNIFYPEQELWIPPTIGETFPVKYIPNDPQNFIILTNEPGSQYSSKFSCTEILMKIAPAKTAYEFDRNDPARKKTYRNILEQYLQTPCDTNLQKMYREELRKL